MLELAIGLAASAAMLAGAFYLSVRYTVDHARWPTRFDLRTGEPETSEDSEPVVPPPKEVLAWIAQESEPWAREEQLKRALDMYEQLEDWQLVLYRLEHPVEEW